MFCVLLFVQVRCPMLCPLPLKGAFRPSGSKLSVFFNSTGAGPPRLASHSGRGSSELLERALISDMGSRAAGAFLVLLVRC